MGQAKRTGESDDGWTGSARRPWMNPPMRYALGSGGRAWRCAIAVDVLVVVAAIVLLVLAGEDVIDRWWTYVAVPFGITAAFAAPVLGVLKANVEDKTR